MSDSQARQAALSQFVFHVNEKSRTLCCVQVERWRGRRAPLLRIQDPTHPGNVPGKFGTMEIFEVDWDSILEEKLDQTLNRLAVWDALR